MRYLTKASDGTSATWNVTAPWTVHLQGMVETEVAIRAAFKAVAGHKQVVLVPTTVLAYQHFRPSALKGPLPNIRAVLTAARQQCSNSDERSVFWQYTPHPVRCFRSRFVDYRWRTKFRVSVKAVAPTESKCDTLTMTATPFRVSVFINGCTRSERISTAAFWTVIRYRPSYILSMKRLLPYTLRWVATDRCFQSYCNLLNWKLIRYIPDCCIAIGHGQMEPSELGNRLSLDCTMMYCYTTIIESGIDILKIRLSIRHFGLRITRWAVKAQESICYLLFSVAAHPEETAFAHWEFSFAGIPYCHGSDIHAGNMLGRQRIHDWYETYWKSFQAVHELKITSLLNRMPMIKRRWAANSQEVSAVRWFELPAIILPVNACFVMRIDDWDW